MILSQRLHKTLFYFVPQPKKLCDHSKLYVQHRANGVCQIICAKCKNSTPLLLKTLIEFDQNPEKLEKILAEAIENNQKREQEKEREKSKGFMGRIVDTINRKRPPKV